MKNRAKKAKKWSKEGGGIWERERGRRNMGEGKREKIERNECRKRGKEDEVKIKSDENKKKRMEEYTTKGSDDGK